MCPETPPPSKVIRASIGEEEPVNLNALLRVLTIVLLGQAVFILSGKSGELRISTSDEGLRIPRILAEERSSARRTGPRPSALPV